MLAEYVGRYRRTCIVRDNILNYEIPVAMLMGPPVFSDVSLPACHGVHMGVSVGKATEDRGDEGAHGEENYLASTTFAKADCPSLP